MIALGNRHACSSVGLGLCDVPPLALLPFDVRSERWLVAWLVRCYARANLGGTYKQSAPPLWHAHVRGCYDLL